jgi:hypothetical protein
MATDAAEIPGRAVTEQEKASLTDRLLTVWKANPQLRLGQLIVNVLADPYYAEDVFLIREIEEYYRA